MVQIHSPRLILSFEVSSERNLASPRSVFRTWISLGKPPSMPNQRIVLDSPPADAA